MEEGKFVILNILPDGLRYYAGDHPAFGCDSNGISLPCWGFVNADGMAGAILYDDAEEAITVCNKLGAGAYVEYLESDIISLVYVYQAGAGYVYAYCANQLQNILIDERTSFLNNVKNKL